jgi:hypothetical protein
MPCGALLPHECIRDKIPSLICPDRFRIKEWMEDPLSVVHSFQNPAEILLLIG